jgi:hypothetical protein
MKGYRPAFDASAEKKRGKWIKYVVYLKGPYVDFDGFGDILS